MHISLILISTVTMSVLVFALLVDRVSTRSDIFSPVSVFVYFSLLSSFSLFWFAVSGTAIYELTFPRVAPQYREEGLVQLAYLFNLASILISYFGIVVGFYVRHPYINSLFNRFFGLNSLSDLPLGQVAGRSNRLEVLGLIFLAIGLVFYAYYVYKIGGLVDLWLNLHNRVERTAGLGYIGHVYKFLIVFGSLLYLSYSLKQRKFKSFLIISVVSVVLVSLGQRGPVVAYIFSVFIVYNYRVKKINKIIGLRTFLILIIVILFFLIFVQFRTPGNLERYEDDPVSLLGDSISSFERHFVDRVNSIERSIVILGYFEKYETWKGASYLGLLLAPIPRGYLNSKPPVDTGRYLLSMAEGNIVNPPVPLERLPSSSWPEGNWAGYMNFHIPGFFIAFFVSGMIFGWIGQLPKSTGYRLLPVTFYAMTAWGVGFNLSPYGVVNLLMSFVLFFMASLFVRLNLRSNKK